MAVPARLPALPEFELSGKHCYLIGIGGCGMSGLARMLSSRGAHVSGSDKEHSPATADLQAEGVAVGFDQHAGRLPEACDLVIASAAIRPDHPEMLAAVSRGVPVMNYAEALGRCMIGRTGVAIAGTHGKSTTVAMLGHALIQSGIDPTVIVGATTGHLARPGGPPTGFRLGARAIPEGPRAGEPGVLVAEACEFNRSFHNLFPRLAAITSVEADHLDIYGTLDAVVESFREFARRIPPASEGGKLLIAHDNAHRREVTAGLECEVHTIGFPPHADWQVTYDPRRRQVGLLHKAQPHAGWTIDVPGQHMAFNSAVAAVIAGWLGAPMDRVARALSTFHGVDRRMQMVGEKRVAGLSPSDRNAPPVRVYDDYGHHPTEIEVTLRALREFERPEQHKPWGGGRLICVFQPHQHSRTRFLLEEFAQAFGDADVVIVPHIYFVRDSEIEKTKVSAADLVDRLRKRGKQAMHLYPFDAIVEQLQNICRPGDLLVVMGAGFAAAGRPAGASFLACGLLPVVLTALAFTLASAALVLGATRAR
ncbi:MAG: UDP-N-acetylmuramate--L-alanine ligase [Phycisphaerales bacterium]|nr:UDP-N-acetylmuramate--L-alanine ligase [Phycisphaerales bacterium]